MPVRNSSATWNGDLFKGKGTVKLGSGAYEGQYNFSSRFESGTGTNPEELLAAAEAACFSMALAVGLEKAGHTATSVRTQAACTIDKVGEGFKITTMRLRVTANVPGIDEGKFQEIAAATKTGCPVSQALAGVDIQMEATLENAGGS